MASPLTLDIDCKGYAVKADIYEGSDGGAVLLSLIGRTSKRTKQRYKDFLPRLANELGITSVIFDYSGHGDSPLDLEDLSPAQHFLEVVTVFDWLVRRYPGRQTIVVGSSYGGFLAALLTKFRTFDRLILRAPAIYRPTDFYTAVKDEDREATMTLRRDPMLLAAHPLLAKAVWFTGEALVVVHEYDEHIPAETTNAYIYALDADTINIRGITHSLDDATQEQIAGYDQEIFDWLRHNRE